MRPVFAGLTTLAWGLWFGGVMALFLFVTNLAATFGPTRRELFSEAASATFFRFELYQLIVGAVALVGAFGWRASAAGRSRTGVFRTGVFIVLSLAALALVVESKMVTPKIDAIRQQWAAMKVTSTPITLESQLQFRKLHGLSMMIYVTQASLLLVAGALLPLAMRDDR